MALFVFSYHVYCEGYECSDYFSSLRSVVKFAYKYNQNRIIGGTIERTPTGYPALFIFVVRKGELERVGCISAFNAGRAIFQTIGGNGAILKRWKINSDGSIGDRLPLGDD